MFPLCGWLCEAAGILTHQIDFIGTAAGGLGGGARIHAQRTLSMIRGARAAPTHILTAGYAVKYHVAAG